MGFFRTFLYLYCLNLNFCLLMSLFGSFFSRSRPEDAIEECSEAIGSVWMDIRENSLSQENRNIFALFVRHPFVLGTVYGFTQPVSRDKGVKFGTESFNGVLASTLCSLVGQEVAMELGDEINDLWINSSEGDPRFENGLGEGLYAGKMYVAGIKTAGKVYTGKGVVDKGPQEPIYYQSLFNSYERILEDDLL